MTALLLSTVRIKINKRLFATCKPFGRSLFAVLTELSEEEDAAGRGTLSAVVIRKD